MKSFTFENGFKIVLTHSNVKNNIKIKLWCGKNIQKQFYIFYTI